MEVYAGTEGHLQSVENTTLEQVDGPEGVCDPMASLCWSRLLEGPIVLWKEEFMLHIPYHYSDDEICFGYSMLWLLLIWKLGGIPPGEVSISSLLHSRLPKDKVPTYKLCREMELQLQRSQDCNMEHTPSLQFLGQFQDNEAIKRLTLYLSNLFAVQFTEKEGQSLQFAGISFTLKASLPLRESTTPPGFVSSANLLGILSSPASKSFMKMLKSTGPKMEPCGTH
ncbi:hypothetical protein BTVI_59750 [Pitangus sulphuratus]|nr:hypothetical protein BTVI_59750 [Pitangus sulphuratus]